MANINMVPVDGTVVIDGYVAFGVNFTGIDPSIHAITWYDVFGELEFVYDPLTKVKPPNQDITSLAPYQSYVNQAQEIIYAAMNPQVYYSTINGLAGPNGEELDLGQMLVVDTPNTPQPGNTTTVAPPACDVFQDLYYYGGAWVCSSFNPSLPLSQAKQVLSTEVKSYAASNCSFQSRIYSTLEMVTTPDPGSLPCADYSTVTLSSYQATMDTRSAEMVDSINAATTTNQLYSFDPRVDANPN